MVDKPSWALPYRYKHLRIEAFQSDSDYSRPQRDMSGRSSYRNRTIHGRKLTQELAQAFQRANQLLSERDPDIQGGLAGVYVEVESAPGESLPDLTWTRENIRLGAARATEEGTQVGALFVPIEAQPFLALKVREYAQGATERGNIPHQAKMEPVETFRAGTIESLWTDQRPLPEEAEAIWWECWCWNDRAGHLVPVARRLELRVSERRLRFPEFEVIPVFGTRHDITRLLQNNDAIEELRLASDTPTFFTTTVRRDQEAWVDDLAERIEPPLEPDAPAVCILDNGVARAHPLIEPVLTTSDCHTVDSAWGTDDHDPDGHGTNMAGAVLYGDLTQPLADLRAITLPYRLESVKFLPPPGFTLTDPQNYGAITQQTTALPEIEAPERPRVFCMAVTNRDVSGERPTSWSAAIDQVCAGSSIGDEPNDDGEPPRRLFVVSAGNIPDASDPDDVSDPDEFPIEDPAQAWNALTVGGFTDKIEITDAGLAGWSAVAAVGDLSPYSRISTDWDQSRTPIKPEVVFEAGNRAISASKRELVAGLDSLSLLTTGRDFPSLPLATFWATSPATAQAAGLAAAIMAENPDFWPETVRALIVHSAEWTPAMLERLRACGGRKTDCIQLARHFGYGVPQIERALASAQNDLALVAQRHIQPFKRVRKIREDGRSYLADPSFNQAHYFQLPWPKESLEALGAQEVRLKVVLSYFVEPSPGETAPVTPSRYQSFGLRYDLKRPRETFNDFAQRINQLERGGEFVAGADADPKWVFGSRSVSAGSLHCDVWVGSAAELAARDWIGIFPVSGWWRYRKAQERFNARARYALVVSITAQDVEVELYTEIANLIGVGVETEITS